jgi:hypothetical protein
MVALGLRQRHVVHSLELSSCCHRNAAAPAGLGHPVASAHARLHSSGSSSSRCLCGLQLYQVGDCEVPKGHSHRHDQLASHGRPSAIACLHHTNEQQQHLMCSLLTRPS